MKLVCTTVWCFGCEQKSDYPDPCNTDALPLRHLQRKNVSSIKQNKNGVKIVQFEMILKKKQLNICIYIHKKVKVNSILVQALRLCTGCTAHRGSRGITLMARKLSKPDDGRYMPKQAVFYC